MNGGNHVLLLSFRDTFALGHNFQQHVRPIGATVLEDQQVPPLTNNRKGCQSLQSSVSRHTVQSVFSSRKFHSSNIYNEKKEGIRLLETDFNQRS
ncbi:unnamed protein product [Lupinus luteus]|uniref:Uncharacterized protein n=1 Tax=Lupinus luteus TaxID=3873 RepID=A0AAV1XWG0_LUPLU